MTNDGPSAEAASPPDSVLFSGCLTSAQWLCYAQNSGWWGQVCVAAAYEGTLVRGIATKRERRLLEP